MQTSEKERIEVPSYLLTQPHPITISVIGAGGTGCFLIQALARINRALIALGKQGLVVSIIDDAVVKRANIGRQLFAKEDIGRYKALALVERINRMYGANFRAYPVRFDISTASRLDCLPTNILITCVDKVAPRKFANSFLLNSISRNSDLKEQWKAFFWIDTGNSKNSGQIVFGCPMLNMPTVIERHPDIQEHEDKDTLPSCSLEETLLEQDLFINQAIAQETAYFIWRLLTDKYIPWSMSYINLDKPRPIIRK